MASHKNHQNIEYKNMRAVVLWLYENRCFVNDVVSSHIECHHCDHDSTNNSLLNFVPLSKEVHKLVSKSKQVIKVTPESIIKLLQNKIDFYEKML